MANSITLTVTRLGTTTADNPALCRVSGYLRDIHGNALPGEALTVRHVYNPIVVGTDTLILNEEQEVVSDGNGLVQFDLYREATVRIELPNRVLDLVREVTVPDASSVDLVALVFPYIVSVAFEDTSPVLASVGASLSLAAVATFSDGTEVDVSVQATYEVSDSDVLADLGAGAFSALAAGSATVSITAVDTDELTQYQDLDGEVLGRLDLPDITYPDAITVEVS